VSGASVLRAERFSALINRSAVLCEAIGTKVIHTMAIVHLFVASTVVRHVHR